MKNKLALSAMIVAFSSTSWAQSNTTLYGIVDLNISHYGAGSRSGAGSVTAMNDGTVNGLNGSRATGDLKTYISQYKIVQLGVRHAF